jgi:hypothetical protein
MASNSRGNAAKRVADTSPGPWKAWPRTLSRWGRAIRFIETYCRAPKGVGHGRPLKLAMEQKEFLEEALADGVDLAVLGTPRGNGKSTFGGGLGTWATFDDDETGAPQVPIVATTVGQAIRSCYGVGVSMIKSEPELLRRALIYTGIATPRIVVPFNEGEMFPISNDPDGLQGLDYSLAVVDEIGFQPIASWDSLRMGSGKRSRSLAIGMGTPGLDRSNALSHIRKAIKEGAVLPGLHFREFAAPDGCDINDREAWRLANFAIGAGFLRESALETDVGITPEGHFRIFRLGQHYDGVDSWLGPNGSMLWDSLADPYDFVAGAKTWVGTDVALQRDSTAVVAVQRDPSGLLRANCKVWMPTRDDPVDVTDVMEYLRELSRAYDVEAISFDPRFFDVPAKMLSDEHLPMIKVDQSVQHMTRCCGSLLEIIKRREVRHDGDDVLRTHVLNAMPRFNTRGFTLEKGKARGKIDGVIALALAVDRALHSKTKRKRRSMVTV